MEQDNLFKKFNLQFFAGEDGDQSEDDNSGEDDNNAGQQQQQQQGKTFTQEEVNAMMAKEKNQGRRSVYSELGFKNEKDAKSAITNYQKFLKSQKSEEELAAENLKNEQTAKSEAEERASKAEAKVQALISGVKPDCLDDVITIAMSKKTDGVEFNAVLKEIKTKYPTLFTDSKDGKDEDGNGDGKDGKKPGEKGTGGNVKNNAGKKDDGKLSLGARLAAQRKGVESKKTFFTN